MTNEQKEEIINFFEKANIDLSFFESTFGLDIEKFRSQTLLAALIQRLRRLTVEELLNDSCDAVKSALMTLPGFSPNGEQSLEFTKLLESQINHLKRTAFTPIPFKLTASSHGYTGNVGKVLFWYELKLGEPLLPSTIKTLADCYEKYESATTKEEVVDELIDSFRTSANSQLQYIGKDLDRTRREDQWHLLTGQNIHV